MLTDNPDRMLMKLIVDADNGQVRGVHIVGDDAPEIIQTAAIAVKAGLTKEQFDAAIPHEFWREVVDRVAVEAPDTLLLAEAFWLMEGYFVRTLGMHRVYNSAFMNMLRDEDNAKYRSVMKNTLEFDPEVLKRFVNFMNNPDERTAVDQFGKSDVRSRADRGLQREVWHGVQARLL